MRISDENTNGSLFDESGHLTEETFSQLIHNQLNDLQSLEVSEHLSFCDQCLEKYTNILCPDFPAETNMEDDTEKVTLLSPPEPLAPSVLQKIQRKNRVFYLKKLTSLAIAASLTLVIWGGDFSLHLIEKSEQISETFLAPHDMISEHSQKFQRDFNRFVSKMDQKVTNFSFDFLTAKDN